MVIIRVTRWGFTSQYTNGSLHGKCIKFIGLWHFITSFPDICLKYWIHCVYFFSFFLSSFHPPFLLPSLSSFLRLFRAAPAAYGGSQARGQIRATAAGLRHSHSNARSKVLTVTCTTAHGNAGSLNPLSKDMDWACIFMVTSCVPNLLSHNGNSSLLLLWVSFFPFSRHLGCFLVFGINHSVCPMGFLQEWYELIYTTRFKQTLTWKDLFAC